MLRPAGLVNNNQNPFGCNCKSGYTGMPAQLNSGVMAYPQGTYFSGECACIPKLSMSQLVNPSNSNSNIPAHIQTNSSNSGGNNMVWKNIQKIEGPYVPTPQQAPCKPGQWCYDSMIGVIKQNGALPVNSSSSSATASASSSSPVAPIQNLMNNWYAWGVQPTNVAGNEPTNTKAALNTMTNQWQFFPSQNAGNSVSANKTSANTTSTANASPQASNVLSEAAQEFEKAINSIFGSISNFVKNL